MDGNKVYDGLKYMALVVLPAISALYVSLGTIWHFPAVVEVTASVTACTAVLGGVLRKSSKNYLERATVAEAVVGQDEDGAAEIRRINQISDEPLMFEDGKRIQMRVYREPA